MVWDERLIGQAEAYQLAADYPVRLGVRHEIGYLDCDRCGQAVLVLGAAGNPWPVTPDGIVSAVIRHAVTAHDMILNRKNRRNDHGRGGGTARGDDQRAAPGGETADGVPAAVRPVGRHARPGQHGQQADRR
jgi:hypothetical protein